MNPVEFPQQNTTYTKPEGWTDDQCVHLPTWVGVDVDNIPVIISCWVPTEQEKQEIVAGKPIFLRVCGRRQPPVSLGTSNPFEVPNDKDPNHSGT